MTDPTITSNDLEDYYAREARERTEEARLRHERFMRTLKWTAILITIPILLFSAACWTAMSMSLAGHLAVQGGILIGAVAAPPIVAGMVNV
jgi:uncharacterized membrane protein